MGNAGHELFLRRDGLDQPGDVAEGDHRSRGRLAGTHRPGGNIKRQLISPCGAEPKHFVGERLPGLGPDHRPLGGRNRADPVWAENQPVPVKVGLIAHDPLPRRGQVRVGHHRFALAVKHQQADVDGVQYGIQQRFALPALGQICLQDGVLLFQRLLFFTKLRFHHGTRGLRRLGLVKCRPEFLLIEPAFGGLENRDPVNALLWGPDPGHQHWNRTSVLCPKLHGHFIETAGNRQLRHGMGGEHHPVPHGQQVKHAATEQSTAVMARPGEKGPVHVQDRAVRFQDEISGRRLVEVRLVIGTHTVSASRKSRMARAVRAGVLMCGMFPRVSRVMREALGRCSQR